MKSGSPGRAISGTKQLGIAGVSCLTFAVVATGPNGFIDKGPAAYPTCSIEAFERTGKVWVRILWDTNRFPDFRVQSSLAPNSTRWQDVPASPTPGHVEVAASDSVRFFRLWRIP
ncbi:MAG: hypothetical protein FJ404_04780 [Verrucomicrobia bacterium]|nr:hypothetical protein [Verrucomicrobiota bacterium]